MSSNCVRCVARTRTGNDLLCDKCREYQGWSRELSIEDQQHVDQLAGSDSIVIIVRADGLVCGHAALRHVDAIDLKTMSYAMLKVVLEQIMAFGSSLESAGQGPADAFFDGVLTKVFDQDRPLAGVDMFTQIFQEKPAGGTAP